MTSSLPRFRGDLAASQQVTPEGVVFVVKDPVREQFYRLPEEAHFIAAQLDGETPLDVVRRRTEEKFHTSLPPEELNAFVGSLNAAGLLETGQNGDTKRRTRRIQGSPLYLRIRFFDPDRLFNYLVGKVRFFFTPLFLVLSSVIILSAVYVAFANWQDAVQDVSRLLRYSAIPVIVLVVFLVVTAHEFAHGLTCKRFGGEVHELGFFLIYLQPAFYCNVSDAWLFPEKSKRLWVGFAGPYFELFLWALATFVWRLTDADTGINYLAYIVMTTSGVKTLLNFNPLIKLDGYYLLSDWLEIPNLRKKGFACFGDGIKKIFGGKVPRLEQMARRERRICLVYGLVAGVGSIWILGYAIMKIGSSLLQQSQPVAFAMSAWFLGLKFRRRFRRLFGKSSNTSVDPDDPDFPDVPESSKASELEDQPFRELANTHDARGGSTLPEAAGSRKPSRPQERLVYVPDRKPVTFITSPKPSRSKEDPVRKPVSMPDLTKLQTVVVGLEDLVRKSESKPDALKKSDLPDATSSPMPPKPEEELVAEPANTLGSPDGSEARKTPAPAELLKPEEGWAARSAKTPETPEDSGLQHAAGSAKPVAPKKGKGGARVVKRLLRLAFLGGATAAALIYLHPELRIKGPFDVLPVHNADVRAGVEGLIEEICVDEGQTVHQGDLIARLFDRDARAELQKTEAGIEEAQAKLRLLVAGPRPEEIEQARIEVAKDAEAITFATSRLDRDKTLYEEKLVSKQELEDSEANLAQRKSELATAKSKLEVLLAGSRREDIEAMKAAITSLETQRNYLQEQLRLMRVVSPASGIVATPSRQLLEMKHQLVKKGDLIAKVYELKTITAEVVVSERDIADVKVGQQVVLKARAYPEMTFYGKVTSIATAAQVSSSSSSSASALAQAQGTAPPTITRSAVAPKTIAITTEIDNSSLFLKPEMTGQAKISCGERRLLDLLTRRIARTVKVEFWSWW